MRVDRAKSRVDEAKIESFYFKRRFFQPRHSQLSLERLLVTDPRDDLMWKRYDLTMPLEALTEFGLGFRLYFDHLRCLAICSLCLTLVSTWNFGKARKSSGTNLLFCDRFEPVCTDIECKSIDYRMVPECQLTHAQSIWDAVACSVFLVFLSVYRVHRHGLVRSLTAASSGTAVSKRTDGGVAAYTVEVTNPPEDAMDPDEWRDFFLKHFGEVCYVTIAKPNREFLQLLLLRRRLLQNLLLNGSALVTPSQPMEESDLGSFPDHPRGGGGARALNGRLVSYDRFEDLFEGGRQGGAHGGQQRAFENNDDDNDDDGCDDNLLDPEAQALASRSAQVRGSRVYISPGGLSMSRDAPWLTGGSVDQAESLTHHDVAGRREERGQQFESLQNFSAYAQDNFKWAAVSAGE